MANGGWLAVYCALILLASLAGGWVPIVVRLTHKRMELAVSFVSGVMLGVGVLHMLPHAFAARLEHRTGEQGHAVMESPSIHDLLGPTLLWLLAGFLAMFLIERFFRFHHHEAPESAHDHAHDDNHSHTPHLSWAGAAIGLSLHSLIEGIALASSMAVVHDGQGTALAGLGAFMVIFLHKPFDSMTIGTLMAVGRRSTFSRHVVNVAFSLLIPVGVLLFYLGLTNVDDRALITSAALAFSAGTFLCISMSDLLPELQFHQHDRVKLSLALLAGLALAWGISAMESRMHSSHDDVPPAAVGRVYNESVVRLDYRYTVMLAE